MKYYPVHIHYSKEKQNKFLFLLFIPSIVFVLILFLLYLSFGDNNLETSISAIQKSDILGTDTRNLDKQK